MPNIPYRWSVYGQRNTFITQLLATLEQQQLPAMKKKMIDLLKIAPFTYYQNAKTRVKRAKSKRLIRSYLKQADRPMLNIGTGVNVLKGWLNTDLYPQKPEVVYLDASIKFPFEDNTFDHIYSEHIFEHLYFEDSCNMLAECYRVLKPNGVMRLALPHIGFLQGLYNNQEDKVNKAYIEFAKKYFIPEQTKVVGDSDHYNIYVINNFYRNWGHQVIHSYETLKELVEKFQFQQVERKEVGESDLADLQGLDGNGRAEYPPEFYKVQTLIIEARKI